MIPWKQTLGWTLCWMLVAYTGAAEQAGSDAIWGAGSPTAQAGADPAPSATESGASEAPAEPGPLAADQPAESAPLAADPPAESAPLAADQPAETAPVTAVVQGPASPVEVGADAEHTVEADLPADMEMLPADASPELAELPADASPGLPADAVAPAAMDPNAAAEPMAAGTPASPLPGAIGYDAEGHAGRIHVVVMGDTLWDISDAYLGTPWVWPSIWQDNGDIADPHLIRPGDRIWITPTEMRRISAEEADAMLANVPAAEAPEVPAALDVDPIPALPPAVPAEARRVRVASLESTGLISPQIYESAASVVGKVPNRVMLSQEDEIYIGLGESEVEPGDQFTLFRTSQRVMDPDTGELLGYHVDLLGWIQVDKTFPETSLATIRMSTGEIAEGDRIMPREPIPPEIAVQPTPEGVEGKITFFPSRRVLMGSTDFVYLNRGTLDGLEVGSPLEVYRAGRPAREVARDELVQVPERVVGKMLVVRADDQSSVALVTSAEGELQLGDQFRGER